MSRLSERKENFNKAYNLYSSVRNAYIKDISDITKLALTQAFEIVFELAWKVLKDFLYTKGISALTPRDAIKEAFSAEIIKNAQVWIDMMNDRNASSHEYNTDKVDLILSKISGIYYEELTDFSEKTGSMNE